MSTQLILDGVSSHTSALGNRQTRAVCGEVTLGGSNPTVVDTGLTRVLGASACLKAAVTPGDDPVLVTVDYSPALEGVLHIYAWKHNGSDPTLTASTNNTAGVAWTAFGLKPLSAPRTDPPETR